MCMEIIGSVMNSLVAVGALLAAFAAFWNGRIALRISRNEQNRYARERRERERVTACFVRSDIEVLRVRLPKASSSLLDVLKAESIIERTQKSNDAINEFNFIKEAVNRLTLEKIGALPEGVAHQVAEVAGTLPLVIFGAHTHLRNYQDGGDLERRAAARTGIQQTACLCSTLADLGAFFDYFNNEFTSTKSTLRH